ncbi:hypothetical protein HK100_012330 [Physocladia obscura]|uniref:Uncharacterized protein n=1 Tax=Physocladia obscura TaxID=109957 RepID=A0AAD5T2R4_9FUNG|nr:hypothetical protein HK100_012330 [Physocladia obscura]
MLRNKQTKLVTPYFTSFYSTVNAFGKSKIPCVILNFWVFSGRVATESCEINIRSSSSEKLKKSMNEPTTARSSEAGIVFQPVPRSTLSDKELDIEADKRILEFNLRELDADLVKSRLTNETMRIAAVESANEAESRVRSATIDLERKKLDFDFDRLLVLAQPQYYGCSELSRDIATPLGIFGAATTENPQIPSDGDQQEFSKLSQARNKLYNISIFNAVTVFVAGVAAHTVGIGLGKIERYLDFHHWNTAFQLAATVTIFPAGILMVVETSKAILDYFSAVIADFKRNFGLK